MAVFNPIVITTAGISLLSQAMAGKGTLTFTSVATSTTVIPYNISNIQAMTALSGIVQTVVPVSAVLKTGNVQVSSIFSNSGVTNAYTANTIGLYAALGNGAQTLFAVAIATTPDNIPVQNDLSPSNFYYQFNIAISDTSQLTVTVPEDGSLPASVFNQMFPGIAAPGQNNDGDALVYNASSGAWGYVNTETVFTTVSGSGEFVSLQKTLAEDFKQIQLFGKSVQKPTTGAQLFDLKAYAEEISDAEIVDYKTGEFTLDTSNIQVNTTALINLCPTMVAGKSYLLTGETTSNNKYLYVGSKKWNFGEVFIPDESDLGAQCYFTCTTMTSESGDVKYYKDTFKNIMIVEGTTEKPYEVYTGGEAATEPTPEFPLPITSAGNYNAEAEKYEVGINVDGANLLDYESWKNTTIVRGTGVYKDNGVVLTANEQDCFTEYTGSSIYSIPILPDTQYVLSWEHSGDYGLVYVFESPTSNGLFLTNKSVSATDNKLTFTTGHNAKYISFRVGVSNSGDIATYKNIQLNVGDTPLEFRPFQGTQQKVLQIPNPFRGIPVDSGGNYTDSDGQQWLCDYIDRERGKYVQCVQECVFDGSVDEKWSDYTANIGFYIPKSDIYTRWEGKMNSPGICNIFSVDDYSNAGVPGVWIGYDTIKYIYAHNTNPIYATNVEEWRAFLQSHNMVVIYPLNTPIETDLAPDQIAALDLSTYQGITNIGTDTMPQVGVEVESQGFNLAGDLAQNLIDLQTTVQSQGSAIAENTEKLNTLGLVGYGRKIASQSGKSVSLISLISEGASIFKSGALYSVYFNVTFSDYGDGDATFQPYIQSSISDGQIHITKIDLPPVYQASSVSMIPYSCTFMIPIDEDKKVTGLSFYVDENSHNFKDMTVAIYRVK